MRDLKKQKIQKNVIILMRVNLEMELYKQYPNKERKSQS